MKRMSAIPVAVLLLMASCKKKDDVAETAASAAGSGSGSASAEVGDAGSADMKKGSGAPSETAQVPGTGAGPAALSYALPADAKVIPEPAAKTADASSLGSDVTVRVGGKLGSEDGNTRALGQFVVVSGAGSLIVEIGRSIEVASKYAADQTLAMVPPLSPPRAFATGDAAAELSFKGSLFYLAHTGDTEVADDIAVAHDGDAIVVWRSTTLNVEGENEVEDWFEQARIKLAPGAKVTAK